MRLFLIVAVVFFLFAMANAQDPDGEEPSAAEVKACLSNNPACESQCTQHEKAGPWMDCMHECCDAQ